MKYIDYKETRKHGTFDFPFALYNVTHYHPRYTMMYHWHPEFEIIRILSGELILQLDGVEIIGRENDSFLITGGALHSGIPKNCHYECIVFNMDFFLRENQPYYKEIFSIVQHNKILQSYYPSEMTEVNYIFENISQALSSKIYGYKLLVQGNFYLFLAMTLQKNYFIEQEYTFDNLNKIKQLKSTFIYIQSHFNEEITLYMLAKNIHMNPNYFCRFFKEITHQTPIQYLNHYRIETACEKLTTTDKTVTEIAMECGFNDVSYFVKVFKKFKGKTPTNYYKLIK